MDMDTTPYVWSRRKIGPRSCQGRHQASERVANILIVFTQVCVQDGARVVHLIELLTQPILVVVSLGSIPADASVLEVTAEPQLRMCLVHEGPFNLYGRIELIRVHATTCLNGSVQCSQGIVVVVVAAALRIGVGTKP